MWDNKKNRLAFDSYFEQISEHIDKFHEALRLSNYIRANYYIKEIQTHFINNIIKLESKTNMTTEQKNIYLSLLSRYDEIKNLPLN